MLVWANADEPSECWLSSDGVQVMLKAQAGGTVAQLCEAESKWAPFAHRVEIARADQKLAGTALLKVPDPLPPFEVITRPKKQQKLAQASPVRVAILQDEAMCTSMRPVPLSLKHYLPALRMLGCNAMMP